ncbi:TPA: hypothetical protein ACHSYA_003792 [Clostridioides difficile]|nr:hypothetical protein [Clostridioides difficile]
MLHNLRKKIFVIFLSCFLFISSTVNSFAFAPALVSVAPEIINVISTLAVASGVVLTTKDDIYDVVRMFYENIPDWDSFVDTFEKNVTISSDNIVRVGNDFLDMCKSAFDSIFLDLPANTTDIVFYGSLKVGQRINLSNHTIPLLIQGTNFRVVADYLYPNDTQGRIGIEFPYADGTGVFLTASYQTNLSIIDYYVFKGVKVEGKKTTISFDFHQFGYSYSDSRTCEVPLAGFPYSLPYVPGSYDWDKVSGKVVSGQDGLDIYVPGDSSDLVGVPSDDVFVGENNPPYDLPASGTVTVPKVENPSLDAGDNIVIPGDSVVDPPVDPPIDPPINPDVPIVGIDFGPLVDAMSNFKDKFPFSLPWDLGRIFQTFDVTPKAPVWEVTLISAKFTIDMTIFEKFFDISRFFIYLSFLVSLIFISVKLKN